MANSFLDLLPSDPATLKTIISVMLAVAAIGVPGLVAALHLHYKGRIETSQQLVVLANAQLAECKEKLQAAEPGRYLAAVRDHQALVSETSSVKIKALEEAISQAEATMHLIEVERDNAVATVQQREDQAAELARLSQEKAVAEARIQELQGSIEQAHYLAEGIQAAALRQARKEQREAEANKDTTRHRFVARTDARKDFERLHERAIAEGRISSAAVEPTVRFFDNGADHLSTVVDVVGHDWYVFLREQPGWYFFPQVEGNHVSFALGNWAKEFARIYSDPRNRAVSQLASGGREFAQIHVYDHDGRVHSLAVLATIKRGHLTPMAHYLSGPQSEVEAGFRAWRKEHGAGLSP